MTRSVRSFLSISLLGLELGVKLADGLHFSSIFRYLNILWKSFRTSSAHWFRGVPQDSVLLPLLFLLYMLDICETLEAGVRMIVYADDIVL